MNDNQLFTAIKKFIHDWSGRGSEKSDAQMFWNRLLTVLGVDDPSKIIEFEKPIDVNGKECFIDGYIARTGVLIEQKSRGVDLDKPAQQSDGAFLTPLEQAKRYAEQFPSKDKPRWIITCNFDEFRIHDLNRLPVFINNAPLEPRVVKFAHLTVEYRYLMFLIDPNDENIEEVRLSKDAANNVGKIHRAFAEKMLAPRKFKASDDPVKYLNPEQRDMLNQFCIRLVFCLYAEDAALFEPEQFINYIKTSANRRRALNDLFAVLNTPVDQRDPNLRAELAAFPFVDGDLFKNAALDIPPFDRDTADNIIRQARKREDKGVLNWFTINPTIFGALFESDLNPTTRREGGMHYTSPANIHKLIKPLFLDELRDEFDAIKRKHKKNRRAALEDFQNKIAALTFFDPACGSGNFLTETYIKLRELENDVLRELVKFGVACEIKVSIEQFYGIEINDFAVAIAQLAMWISESKMFYDTEVGVRKKTEPLPLKRSARIVCANALTIDWKEIVPDSVDYIIGNPPFRGYFLQTTEQKNDLISATGLNNKKMDYVTGWYYKAAQFMSDNQTRAAFVSTNSIVQGEQVSAVWQKLFETIHIDFAHRTFKWTHDQDDPDETAAVYCVIVGFSVAPNKKPRLIFDGEQKTVAANINAYLNDAPNYFVEKRTTPLCDVPPMILGSIPRDGGNLIIEVDDYEEFIRQEPRAQKFIRRLIGSEEFINGKDRWCLWLVDAKKSELRLPLIAKRLKAVKRFRLSSKRATTKKLAATPHLFAELRQPSTNYIVVPSVSGERRKYIPMGFLPPDVIATNLVLTIPDGGLFEFGVLQSIVHMAWTRVTAGYLGTSYRYSATIVYNNFPWCAHSARIEQTAQAILDARALYPDWTLAALYDPDKMPSELRAAHIENDHAVLDAYGFARDMSEAEIVSCLMEMYEALIKKID